MASRMPSALSPASASPVEARAYSKAAWRIVPFVLLCYILAYLDRVNVGFAKLEMLSDLRFSETVYGLGAGIFFVGYFLFEVPSNIIMYKVGARRWIARIMITWGIVAAAMMFVRSPLSFYALRFLLGMAEAGFIPGILLYLTFWFPPERRGKMTALFLSGIPLSGVIGGPVSGWILHGLNGSGGLAGWQWLFLLEGIPTFLIGIVTLFLLDDRIADAKWLSPEEKIVMQANIDRETRTKHHHSMGDAFSEPKVWLLALTYALFLMGLYGVSFWLPTLIKEAGVKDPLNVGLLTAIPYLAGFFGMVFVSRRSDRTGERRFHLAMPGIAGAVGLAFSVAAHQNTVAAMAAFTLATFGIMTTVSQFWNLPPAFLSGAAAAAGIAFVNSVGNISGFVAPYLVGWVKDATHSTNGGVLVIAGCLVAASLLVFAVPAALVNVRREPHVSAGAVGSPLPAR